MNGYPQFLFSVLGGSNVMPRNTNTVITIDAMGCQKKIAKKIIKKEADYVLAIKGNQANLYKEVIDLFDKIKTPEFAHSRLPMLFPLLVIERKCRQN